MSDVQIHVNLLFWKRAHLQNDLAVAVFVPGCANLTDQLLGSLCGVYVFHQRHVKFLGFFL